MGAFTYTNTILHTLSTKGKLRQDPDGYYDVILGGFDVHNSAGDFYDFASAKAHFDNASEFMRRISSGSLYGEMGHPVMTPGMSKAEWIVRILTIDPGNRSHHIREVHMDDTSFKGKDGEPMVTIFGRIKPIMESLEKSLDNEHENTAFSIRCLTHNHFEASRGCMVRSLTKPVTWDYVIEPGIFNATKYHTPTLEHLAIDGFEDMDVRQAINFVRENYSGMESASIIKELNDLIVPVKKSDLSLNFNPRIPASRNWR